MVAIPEWNVVRAAADAFAVIVQNGIATYVRHEVLTQAAGGQISVLLCFLLGSWVPIHFLT